MALFSCKFFRRFFTAAIALPLFFLTACNFYQTITQKDETAGELSLDQSSITLDIGEMAVINLAAEKNQGTADIEWSFSRSVMDAYTDNYGCIVTATESGESVVTASCGGYSATCIVRVTKEYYKPVIENPYIYASQDVVTLGVGETKKIFAAAYGGTSEINSYEWSVDKISTATIKPEGNYCWITGNTPGQARVSVKNTDVSQYPYSVLVNVTGEGLVTPYITTETNVISLNITRGETAEFNVELKNPPSADYEEIFDCAAVDENREELSEAACPVKVTCRGKTFLVEPVMTGTCVLRITHPSAPYSLDIIARVNRNESLSYVELSEQNIVLSSALSTRVVTASLMNGEQEYTDPAKFIWKASDNASAFVRWQLEGGDGDTTGNTLRVWPVASGAAKFTVTCPAEANNSASVVVLVRNIETEAADATTYIATSQNYIKAVAGGDDIRVNVDVYNMEAGGENKLMWTIENDPRDGTKSDVIEWVSGTGSHQAKYKGRSAAEIRPTTSGYSIIRPKKAGTATITLTHPKAMYPTEIKVNVVEAAEMAKAKAPWYLSTKLAILKLVSGDEESATAFTVMLDGEGVTEDDRKKIKFESPDSDIVLVSDGENCSARYKGNSAGRTFVTVSHPDSAQKITIPVVYAATLDELSDAKIIFSGSPRNCTLEEGMQSVIDISSANLEESDIFRYSISNPDVLEFSERTSERVTVLAKEKGYSSVTVSVDGIGELVFNYIVTKKGVIDDAEDVYLSTRDNVVFMENPGDSYTATISAVNLTESGKQDIQWTLSNPAAFDVQAGGERATITALKENSEADLVVSHPDSMNSLTIRLRCGNRFAFKNEDIAYIQTDMQSITIEPDDTDKFFTAVIAHTESTSLDTSGIVFESSNSGIVRIEQEGNVCRLYPVSAGVATITVSSSQGGVYPSSVSVAVNNRKSGEKTPYITSQTNVVTVMQGEYTAVTASLVNALSADPLDWKWTVHPEDNDICSLSGVTGSSVMIKGGSKTGAGRITVENRLAPGQKFSIIAVVVDSFAAKISPYIFVSKNIMTLEVGSTETFTSELIGGDFTDGNFFEYESSSPRIAVTQGAGTACAVTAMSEGLTYITVKNSRHADAYQRQVVVRVRNKTDEGCRISTNYTVLTINPDKAEDTVVFAELEGGSPIDANDFIWSIDNPTLLNISYAAGGECHIKPMGRSGTAKLVCHHKKAADKTIVVTVSKYSQFSFESDSVSLYEGNVAFVAMQVPDAYEDVDIKYTSTNENISAATGTQRVCLIKGARSGSAMITATLYSGGAAVATSACYVEVAPMNATVPVITPSMAMLSVEWGETKTVEAAITGSGLPPNADARLKWELKPVVDGANISMSPSRNGMTTGNLVSLSVGGTSTAGGEYILRITYLDNPAVYTDVLVMVPAQNEIKILLSATNAIYYADSGAFELYAQLLNAPEGEMKNVKWYVQQSETNKIISISNFGTSTSGALCSFAPIKTGSCFVYAMYEGANPNKAVCCVTIKDNGIIVPGTTSLTVPTKDVCDEPQKMPYRTVPEGAKVIWSSIQNTGLGELGTGAMNFTFVDTGDTLEITGLVDCGNNEAGSILGVIEGSNGSPVEIKVYVKNSPEFEIDQFQLEFLNPAAKKHSRSNDTASLDYTLWPQTWDVNWQDYIDKNEKLKGKLKVSSITKNVVTSETDGKKKIKGTVEFKAIGVFDQTSVQFEADNNETEESKRKTKKAHSVYFRSYYDEYIPEVTWTDGSDNLIMNSGNNTNYKNSTLTVGDGESAVCAVSFPNEPYAEIESVTVSYSPNQNAAANGNLKIPSGNFYGTYPNQNHKHWMLDSSGGLLELKGTDGGKMQKDSKGIYTFTFGHSRDIRSDLLLEKNNGVFTYLQAAEENEPVFHIDDNGNRYTLNPQHQNVAYSFIGGNPFVSEQTAPFVDYTDSRVPFYERLIERDLVYSLTAIDHCVTEEYIVYFDKKTWCSSSHGSPEYVAPHPPNGSDCVPISHNAFYTIVRACSCEKYGFPAHGAKAVTELLDPFIKAKQSAVLVYVNDLSAADVSTINEDGIEYFSYSYHNALKNTLEMEPINRKISDNSGKGLLNNYVEVRKVNCSEEKFIAGWSEEGFVADATLDASWAHGGGNIGPKDSFEAQGKIEPYKISKDDKTSWWQTKDIRYYQYGLHPILEKKVFYSYKGNMQYEDILSFVPFGVDAAGESSGDRVFYDVPEMPIALDRSDTFFLGYSIGKEFKVKKDERANVMEFYLKKEYAQKESKDQYIMTEAAFKSRADYYMPAYETARWLYSKIKQSGWHFTKEYAWIDVLTKRPESAEDYGGVKLGNLEDRALFEDSKYYSVPARVLHSGAKMITTRDTGEKEIFEKAGELEINITGKVKNGSENKSYKIPVKVVVRYSAITTKSGDYESKTVNSETHWKRK